MKKILLVLAIALVAFAAPSCKNQNKKQAKEAEAESAAVVDMAKEALAVDVANLIESAKQIKFVPFVEASKEGKIEISKFIKPDYMADPAIADKALTLSQQYRASGILYIDRMVLELSEQPVDKYNAALVSLLKNINDPAFSDFFTLDPVTTPGATDAYVAFVDAEYEAERANFFWEAVSSCLIEQLFIITRDIDRYMPMFDDQSAADVTYNFVCVHEGLKSVIAEYPEMAGLNEVLEPLYVINAISVDQLKEQLVSVKKDIEVARAYILK